MQKMRETFLPYHRPQIESDDITAVVEVLRSGWLTTGPKTLEFEQEFAKYIGCKHAVAVNSGTAALHLALDAIGLKEGDEVIIPTMTFAATGEVVEYFKAKPVLVDCRPDTLNIDPAMVEAYLDRKPKRVGAIIAVHIAGQPCELNRLLEIAKKHELIVIEDAAHALPAKYRDRQIGTVSPLTAFSFYATKNITTGEGGMITTDNDGYAERCQLMRLHGISTDAWRRYTAEGCWSYEILAAGYKYNPTDIASALGLTQLRKLERLYQQRLQVVNLYNEAFSEVEELHPLTIMPQVQHAWHLYIIHLRLEKLKINRDRFIQELRARNIGTAVHFIPLHMHPYYRDKYGYQPDDFPSAKYVSERIVSLPLYPGMSQRDVGDVVDAIRDVIKRFRR